MVIERRALDEVCSLLAQYPTDTLLLVIDEKVAAEYGPGLNDLVTIPGKRTFLWCFSPRSQRGKSWEAYRECCDFFLSQKIHRQAHLVAIGGGSTSDLAGFAAATLLRGISWSVVPTTLLSMVDGAIGGKTGLDTSWGKNLVGCFHLPENVWIDTCFLQTLPREELANGWGEIAKYAFLNTALGGQILSFLEERRRPPPEDIILACALAKEAITSKDREDKRERHFLNLGHTFGHALESAYGVPHGVAVFWGIAIELKLLGRTELLPLWRRLSSSSHLLAATSAPPLEEALEKKKLWSYIERDKKITTGGKIVLVDLPRWGRPKLVECDLKVLKETFEGLSLSL